MQLDIIQEALRREPFEPFAVHLADGANYLVRAAGDAIICGNSLAVALHDRRGRPAVTIDPHHVVRLVPVAAKPKELPAEPPRNTTQTRTRLDGTVTAALPL